MISSAQDIVKVLLSIIVTNKQIVQRKKLRSDYYDAHFHLILQEIRFCIGCVYAEFK